MALAGLGVLTADGDRGLGVAIEIEMGAGRMSDVAGCQSVAAAHRLDNISVFGRERL